MASSKIKTRAQIKVLAETLRNQGKRIVTCNGSYDLLHAGHVRFLQEAKAQGDVLIVGVNSNASIHLYKSKNRPIIDEKDRLETLAALSCVDYAVLMDEPEIAVPLIRLVKPHVHANGADYGENCVEAGAIRECGARLHLVQRHEGLSTSGIIEKIIKLHQA